MTETQLEVDYDFSEDRTRINANVVVRDGDEFVGDFAVTFYKLAGQMVYEAEGLKSVRAIGGIYAEGRDPTDSLLTGVASMIESKLPRSNVRHIPDERDEQRPDGGTFFRR